MPVQTEVANTHIAQVFQTGADFFQQQMQGLLLGLHTGRQRGVCGHVVEKSSQTFNRQQHQVVQTQAWQCFQLAARPRRALWQKAFVSWHGGQGTGMAADAPQQAFGLQSRPVAFAAGGVAAVLGQQHPDVHLVGLGFQVFKEAFDAIPLLVPFAIPIGRAFDDPVALFGRQLVPRRVAWNTCCFGMAHQIVLALLPSRCLHWLDRTHAQGEFVVGNDQAVVDPNDTTKTFAHRTSTSRRIEREHRWGGVAVAQIAVRAMQPGGIAKGLAQVIGRSIGRHAKCRHAAVAALQGQFNGFHGARLLNRLQTETIGHHVHHLALAVHPGEAAGTQPSLQFLGRGVVGQFHREGDDPTRVATAQGQQFLENRVRAVVLHRLRGLLVKQMGGTGEQQFQMVVQLGHGAHGGARTAHRVGLVDGDGRRHAFHLVDGRAVHAVKELSGIGAERFHIAPLAFSVQGVKHQAGFTRATGAGEHRQLVGADVYVDVFEVVLSSTSDADQALGHARIIPRGKPP